MAEEDDYFSSVLSLVPLDRHDHFFGFVEQKLKGQLRESEPNPKSYHQQAIVIVISWKLVASEESLAAKNDQQVFSSLYNFETMELALPLPSGLYSPESKVLNAYDKARHKLRDYGMILFYYCGHSTKFDENILFHPERKLKAG
jgi:hypothetical protein